MKTVLFVDDDPRVLEGLENLLFDYSDEWDVVTATGGAEALNLLAHSTVDVLVTDMRMPGIDGAELLSDVKDLYPNLVLFVLSGHAETEAMLSAISIAHQYLSKPCSAERLVGALRNAQSLLELLNAPEVTSKLGQLTQLPPRPEIYSSLVQATLLDDSDFDTVTDIVEEDAAIALRVLQVANSAFFSRDRPCHNVRNAVGRVGINNVKGIAAGLESARSFPGISLNSIEAFHDHSAWVAHCAQRIAPEGKVADDAFFAAILHDVGTMVLASIDPDGYAVLISGSAGLERICREQNRYGASHAEIGGCLLQLWGFDYTIIEAVTYHHDIDKICSQYPSSMAYVGIANLLCEHQSGFAVEEEVDRVRSLVPEATFDDWCRIVTEERRGA